MTRPLIYDGLRAYLGASAYTPRGVNRVDHVYARHLLDEWPGDVFSMLPTPWGARLYDRAEAVRFVAYLQTLWRENRDETVDPAFDYFRERLLGGPDAPQASGARRRRSMWSGLSRAIRANGFHVGRPVVSAAPRDAVYVNVGQVCWAAPNATRWLGRRPDVKAVFMLHDVIPLERPEFVSRLSRIEMDWMLGVVIRRAAGLITTTQAASDAVMATLRDQGMPEIPVCPLHLPVDETFRQAEPADPALLAHPYFLVCGAIEPRKNTRLLLHVWQRLVETLGEAAPRLVIAGTVEGRGEPILRQIQGSATLRHHVIVVSGVGTPNLRQMMVNARALLMPSFAEGFGLPVVEALTVGTPVLASDIPAHREIGGAEALYLDPHDEDAWVAAITGLMQSNADYTALRQRVRGYVPMTEAEYFHRIRAFLTAI
jgi:glycosyltransferase involved in cell wall biosynthesis